MSRLTREERRGKIKRRREGRKMLEHKLKDEINRTRGDQRSTDRGSERRQNKVESRVLRRQEGVSVCCCL